MKRHGPKCKTCWDIKNIHDENKRVVRCPDCNPKDKDDDRTKKI